MQWMKTTCGVGLVLSLLLAGGCQPWEQKYRACNAELENLKAIFDSMKESADECSMEKQQLNQELSAWKARYNECQNELQAAQAGPAPVDQGAGGLGTEGGVYDPTRGTITVPLTSDVLFDSGKVTLKSTSKSRLDRIAGIIKREHAGKEIWVIGHTDTDPIKKSKWKDNWQLSTERALAVTRYLISQNVAAQSLVAAGRGEHHPISNNKAQNRRVEIVVYTR